MFDLMGPLLVAPLRQVRLQDHRCPAGLPQLLGSCHGPEAWQFSTDPYGGLDAKSRPPGAVFGGAAPLAKPVKINMKMEKGSM